MGRDPRNAPIAITGMHRSGTSMITRALHDSGLHLIGSSDDELIDAAEDNPEGFWENKAIVACNDALLEATGGSWDNPPDLPPQAVDDPRVSALTEASVAALASLSEHARWGFKDPRLCLTAAYWLDLQPDLRFIICVRHPLEVALSLKRRNQNSYSLGLALWERYYATVLELIPPERRLVTHYDTFFVDPVGEIGRLCDFAGLEAATPRVRTDLRHHTIGVDLGDAGVSESLLALYRDLCREAGAPVPPAPVADEGRVRRLILDGAVAQRHADQRQAAIDRLEEREAEFRKESAQERARIESEHRERVRALEARTQSLQQRTLDTVQKINETVARTESAMKEIDGRTRTTSRRLDYAIHRIEGGPVRKKIRSTGGKVMRRTKRLLGRGRRAAVPAARTAARQLPDPAQQQVARARRVVRQTVADPRAGAETVGRQLAPAARSAAKQLPPPAREALRRNQTRILAARRAPAPTAKRIARRLPPGAQRQLRRAWRVVEQMQQEGVSAKALGADDGPKAAPAPKGPALRQWKAGYERMVAAAIPQGAEWLVVTPGSPKEVRDAHSPKAAPFPDTRKGKPFADDLSYVAHLEALRYGGQRYLVLPEGSRPWFRQRAELRDHILRTYRTVVDREDAGAVFNLADAPPDSGARSLRGEVNRLAEGLPYAPAVLDRTSLELAAELPGLATFLPPVGERLPYVDRSVDIVVLDEEHDLEDARRVASLGVITVGAGASGVEVRDVERIGDDTVAAPPRVLVWSTAGADERWVEQLSARAAAAGADLRIAEIEAEALAATTDYDVVVVVEPQVLPLPGAIEAAAALVAARPDTAVAGKVLRPDGRIESAGGTVFFDRSVALIAGSAAEVRAPWHDYVRPVCWAPGLVAAAPSLWAAVPGPAAMRGRDYLREWCADVWAEGGAVVYQPAFTAVRVSGDGEEPSFPLRDSAWQRVLDLRPQRPADLSDGAWRYLLAHDDVEACRG